MHIKELIENFYQGKLSKEELTYLLNYLKDNEPQYELLFLYQKKWDEASELNTNIDSERIYNRIVSKVDSRIVNKGNGGMIPVKGSPERKILRKYIITTIGYAAVFVMAFGLSWLVHSSFGNKTANSIIVDQIQTVEVPYGSKSHIILPDKSIVTLNSGSSLKYSSSDFDAGRRSVALTGEGFFNVSKDTKRPFYVITSGIKVKVLGTTFNIKAYADENIEETTLISGKVEIFSSSDKTEQGMPIVLRPNQSAVFVKSENTIHKNDNTERVNPENSIVKLRKIDLMSSSKTEQTISWKENRLVFENESFSTLVIKLERWYDVKILVTYPELNSTRVTGKFDKETLEQVLKALATVTPFRYDIKQNHVRISKD